MSMTANEILNLIAMEQDAEYRRRASVPIPVASSGGDQLDALNAALANLNRLSQIPMSHDLNAESGRSVQL